jgi:hypothetical protein
VLWSARADSFESVRNFGVGTDYARWLILDGQGSSYLRGVERFVRVPLHDRFHRDAFIARVRVPVI